jgi:hypothetical protein
MSKQFSILLTDVDLGALEKVLLKSGDVELLSTTPIGNDQSLPPLHALPIPISQAGKVSLFCYLAPVDLPRHIVLKGQSVLKVDDHQSHLIEVWRSWYNGQIIKAGRLWYENNVWGNPKDPDFCRWADRVMARVRRSLTYNKNADAYIGADTLDKLASGAITQRSVLNENSIVPFKMASS